MNKEVTFAPGKSRCHKCNKLFHVYSKLKAVKWGGFDVLVCRDCFPDQTTKPTNPKDAVGSNKLPIHLWPTTATAMGSLALLDGMLKYGRSNFRAIGVRSSIYFDAVNRHLNAWFEGEDNDPDSGLPHLAHALAGLAILVDAEAAGKLNDDRMTKGGYRKLVNELTPHVERLKELHADKNPHHYTIKGSEGAHERK